MRETNTLALATDSELLVAFDQAQEREGRAQSTRYKRQQKLLVFSASLSGRGLLEATTTDLEAWLATCRVNRRTSSMYVGHASAFFRWARDEGLVAYDPAAPLKRPNGALPEQDQGELFELLRGFQVAQERRALSPATIESRRYHLRRLAKFIAPKSLLDMTTEDLNVFLDGRRISPKTRHSYLGSTRAFYKWTTREGITDEDPIASVDLPRLSENLPRPIADADLAEAIRQAPPAMKAWLCLAAFEGLRCSEIASLCREDILDRSDPPMLMVRKGKGRKQRLIPLHPSVWRALRLLDLPRAGFVFTKRATSTPYTATYVSQKGGLYLRSLSIPASMHQLRHWFGTNLYKRTRDLRMVQEMLGHSSPTTTAIYCGFNPGDAVGAVTSLEVSQ